MPTPNDQQRPLFDAQEAEPAGDSEGVPLAARMRPRSLEEFVGQEHLIGPGRALRRAIESDQMTSFILWGPPWLRSSPTPPTPTSSA